MTATRHLDEAWRHVVTRTVSLSADVTGEARIVQELEHTLSGPALAALEAAMAAPDSGWQAVEGGFRHDVEGGYVRYDSDAHSLEIAAVLGERVEASGMASRTLEGRRTGEAQAEGESDIIYDDGYRGRDEAVGKKEAQALAEKNLAAAARSLVEGDKAEAEKSASEQVEGQARGFAQANLEDLSRKKEQELAQRARSRLEAVGTRCRLAFNQVLAQGYKGAILAYAKSKGAQGIKCSEEGEFIDIEFNFQG